MVFWVNILNFKFVIFCKVKCGKMVQRKLELLIFEIKRLWVIEGLK